MSVAAPVIINAGPLMTLEKLNLLHPPKADPR
jgi:hypothetical protein